MAIGCSGGQALQSTAAGEQAYSERAQAAGRAQPSREGEDVQGGGGGASATAATAQGVAGSECYEYGRVAWRLMEAERLRRLDGCEVACGHGSAHSPPAC